METLELRATVLQALYNRSRPQGMGYLQPKCIDAMTLQEATECVEKYDYFDYVRGRVIKVSIPKTLTREKALDLDFRLYDRDIGDGAGYQCVKAALGILS